MPSINAAKRNPAYRPSICVRAPRRAPSLSRERVLWHGARGRSLYVRGVRLSRDVQPHDALQLPRDAWMHGRDVLMPFYDGRQLFLT